ncbi:hypothetical protein CMI39_03380 [Candidatus Pacearchaeota archaeon]|jgi:hypothetical protein|nr:hypothetical protein [Candidatus Pacearchaeota archaeon]|tara:strand:- start:7576 stop:7779 length:204 start_codon:yes stop_codon:yes gene_type:complete
MKSLEEKTKKLDWKEWIPLWGTGQTFYNHSKGKASIFDIKENNPKLYWLNVFEQGVSYVCLYNSLFT